MNHHPHPSDLDPFYTYAIPALDNLPPTTPVCCPDCATDHTLTLISPAAALAVIACHDCYTPIAVIPLSDLLVTDPSLAKELSR